MWQLSPDYQEVIIRKEPETRRRKMDRKWIM
jgi:hypothetical protein